MCSLLLQTCNKSLSIKETSLTCLIVEGKCWETLIWDSTRRGGKGMCKVRFGFFALFFISENIIWKYSLCYVTPCQIYCSLQPFISSWHAVVARIGWCYSWTWHRCWVRELEPSKLGSTCWLLLRQFSIFSVNSWAQSWLKISVLKDLCKPGEYNVRGSLWQKVRGPWGYKYV